MIAEREMADGSSPLYFLVELPSVTSLTRVRTKLCERRKKSAPPRLPQPASTHRLSSTSRSVDLIDDHTRRLVACHSTIHRERTTLQSVANAVLDDFARSVVGSVDLEHLVASLTSENVGEGRLAESGWAAEKEDLYC